MSNLTLKNQIMKKIFVAIAAVAAITFTSCGNSTNEATNQDTTEVAAETDELAGLEEAIASGDEDAVKEELGKLQEMASNLDSAEVKKFAYKLQEFAANHKEDLDKLATGEFTVADLINGIQSVPSTVGSLGNEAKDAATSDANTVNKQVKAAAEETKAKVKEEAKAKANEAAEAATKKANEETTKAINSAAEALKNKLK